MEKIREKKLTKKERRFLEILDASRKIFAKYGYKKASIEDVAKAVNLEKGSLYYYFKSKEELFLEVVKTEGYAFLEKIQKDVMSESTARKKMEKYFSLRLAYFKDLRNLYSVTEETIQSLLPFVDKIRMSFLEQEKSFIVKILHEGIARKEFRIKDPNFVAIAIIASLRGIEPTMLIYHAEEFGPEKYTELMNILFDGICVQ